ncbi:MAG: PIN domain-containing protein [Austwickia sp.]|nr:PIN domain-containing protein [Austwickia sp.]
MLDTSVLIERPGGLAGWAAAISAVSLAELRFGVLVAADTVARAKRLRRLEAVVRVFDPLPVDEVVADHYAELAALVRSRGRQPRARQFDLLIAATAVAHDATLLTHNLADFAGLESFVRVERP